MGKLLQLYVCILVFVSAFLFSRRRVWDMMSVQLYVHLSSTIYLELSINIHMSQLFVLLAQLLPCSGFV